MMGIAIENIGSHVGMGDLLDGKSVTPIPAERVADNAGGRRAQHLNPISPVVLDDIWPRDLVVGEPHADVRRRAPEDEDAILSIVLDGVIDDARKAVLETSRPVLAACSMVLVSTTAVAPLLIAMPKEPPVTVKPLIVTSRPRTWIAGRLASAALIVALRCPSRVMRWSSGWIRIFS